MGFERGPAGTPSVFYFLSFFLVSGAWFVGPAFSRNGPDPDPYLDPDNKDVG